MPNKRINSPKRGAPQGNRNALQNGRKSLFIQGYLYHKSTMLACIERAPRDGSGTIASPKQQTTSLARNSKGGAPKGNKNALKTGRYTAQNKANKRRVAALIKRAHLVIAEVEERLPRHKPGPKSGSHFASSRTPATGARIPPQGG